MKFLLLISLLTLNAFAGSKDPAEMLKEQRKATADVCYNGSVEQVKKLDQVWDINHNIIMERNCLFLATEARNFDVGIYLLNKYPTSVFYKARENSNFFDKTGFSSSGAKPLKNPKGDEFYKQVIQLWMTHPLSPADRDYNYIVSGYSDYNLLLTTQRITEFTEYDFYPEIKKMIEAGASRNFRNEKHHLFSVRHAVHYNKPRLVKYYMSLGDDAGPGMEAAVYNQNLKMLKLIVENGGNIHHSSEFGNLLHFSVHSPNLDILKYLLSQGVSKTHKSKYRQNAYESAQSLNFNNNQALKQEYLKLLKP